MTLGACEQGLKGREKSCSKGGGDTRRLKAGHSWPRLKSEADATGRLLPRASILSSLGTAQGDGTGPGAVLPLLRHLCKDL